MPASGIAPSVTTASTTAAVHQTIRAGLYGRVSRVKPGRHDKDRERSVDQQLAANEKACARYS